MKYGIMSQISGQYLSKTNLFTRHEGEALKQAKRMLNGCLSNS